MATHPSPAALEGAQRKGLSGQWPTRGESELMPGNDWNLVGGVATPLKNMKVNWYDYSKYMGK